MSGSLTVGLLAHVDAGKTTLSEAMLYQSGTLRRLGRVDHRDAFLDTDVQERERGITIFSKQAELSWQGRAITLVDTPGHVDFSGETERALRVLDCAVLVISAADGVQGHTATLWRLLQSYHVPTFLFINKMDQPGANRRALMEELKNRLSDGCVDMLSPDRMEQIATCSEEALAYYLQDENVPDALIAQLTAQRLLFPCFFGSALRLEGIDALLMMVDVTAVGPQDRKIAEDMAKKGVPAILLLNKCDLIDNERVLPVIDQFKEMGFAEILPISAKTSAHLDLLTQELFKLMPTGPRYFPEDMITDQPERVLCAEIVREKALLHLRDEVPHGVGVEILGMKKVNDNLMEIHADIYCERDSHKAIIIGKRGAMLSLIGREARVDMEALLGMRVNLQLWVKVRPDWRNSAADLKTLGYDSKEMR